MNTVDTEAYEVWKQNGSISLKTCDILGTIGLFIFGWLLWYVYDRAGEKGGKFFIPIIALYVLGFRIHFVFSIFAMALYIYAWVFIHKKIKTYQEKYEKEAHTNI